MMNTTRLNPYQISATCICCKREHILSVSEAQEAAWKRGAHIQNVMHHLSPAEREILISGYCSIGWAAIFGGRE